jgi:tetratricopeptide (TPR) repeat protein
LFFSVLAFVHQYAIRNTVYEVEKAKDRFVAVSDTYVIAVACGAVCVFGLAFYQFNMKPIAANNTLIDALRPSMRDPRTGAINTNTPKNKFELMQKSIAYGSMTNGEQIEQLAERGVELINSSATTPEEKRSAHQYVSEQYIALFGRTPEDPRPYFFYAMYLQRIGLVQESMQVAEKIVSLSPNKQSFLNFYARLLLQNNRQEEGLELNQKAYELDTTNTNGKYMYLAALVQNRKTVEAELEARGDMRAYVTNQYVGEAYIQSMQSNRLIELIKGGISVYPTDVDLRSQLAGVYVKTEQYQLAISTLQEIKEIAPQYAQNIDQAILEIQTESGIKK